MSTSGTQVQSSSEATFLNHPPRLTESLDHNLSAVLKEIHTIVPPLWPLADYVAVNPCVGLTDRRFLEACQLMSSVRNCSLLMPRDYYRAKQTEGRLSARDLHAAHTQCRTEYPEWYHDFEASELADWLADSGHVEMVSDLRFRTVAEAVDEHHASTWSSHIINDVTRHCAAHYDGGQATWTNPWSKETLYSGWRLAAQFSWRMELLGLPGFRAQVANLPECPRQAVMELLSALDVPSSHWRMFLLSEIYSVAGWASYVRYQVREAENAGSLNDDLVGLLAIRLAYDVALARTPGVAWPLPLWPADADLKDESAVPPTPATGVLARYALQVAMEQGYRHQLLQQLANHSPSRSTSDRKALQMVFCIDVRSEVLRRNLESVDESIETYGFAGFFGMPLEYIPLGFAKGTPQCPVLLQPSFGVHEQLRGCEDSAQRRLVTNRLLVRQARKLWKSFQCSATSCFSFVESLGLAYLGKLLTDSSLWTRPVADSRKDGLSSEMIPHLGPDVLAEKNWGLDASSQIDLAEGMLRNLGLTAGFARMVVLCGHASDVTNNPYRAALDCGACGGHSGEPNARVAAALLNDTDVRIGLAARGIVIPVDTRFLAALHNTTTDEIVLYDSHSVPTSHREDLEKMEIWLKEAGRLSRMERCPRLGAEGVKDPLRRSRDWSEVRPEWGLAGNAAFIVAPRSRTYGLKLDGRTFMHSYDHRLDPELKVLELIMTAPMVVTNWINMQYYASSVDPEAFGSGNKLIHNVVGQFGVLQGNGGDLMTGLPWQSVHDGLRLQHEPLRLTVVINAPRSSIQHIIEKHGVVSDLATNGWVSVVAWEDDGFYSWTATRSWEILTV